MRSDPPTIRMTPQRQVILAEVRRVLTHPTADEVYAMVRSRLPRISLGTVYRNLEMLAECGAIRRLDGIGRQRRYDGNLEAHHHVRCLRCGRLGDVFAGPIRGVESQVRGSSGYEIMGYRLEFTGLCPQCRGGRPSTDPKPTAVAKECDEREVSRGR